MSSMTNLQGKIHTTEQPGLKVHTYTAPDDGWVVNTHLVELPKQVIAVDAQYTIPYAKEALAYATTLGKPVTRLYVSHYHPDHLLGAPAFGLPIHALSEVKAKIEAVGDLIGHLLNAHAQPAASCLAIATQLIDDRHSGLRGDGKADADRTAGRRNDRGVDADDFTVEIE